MAQLYSNNAISRLVVNVSEIATSIHIDPARAGTFPDPQHFDDFFLITLEDINDPDLYEIVKISHRTGSVLHVAERGYENTNIGIWTTADTICDHRVTAGTLDSFLPVTKIKHSTVLPNSFKVVDQFQPSSENVTYKWQLTVLNPTTQKVNSFELHAVFKTPLSTLVWNKFAIIGDTIDFSVTPEFSGGLIKLKIENRETTDLSINAFRIQFV